MYKIVKGYLFDGKTAVLNKSDIKNAKNEDFKEITLYIHYDFIKESNEELEYIDF